MSALESVAALCGLANIVLIARRSLWNFAFGTVMVCLYFKVFLDARLYSAAALQVFFLAAQAYGWWYWRQSATAGPVPVRSLSPRGRGSAMLAAGLLMLALGITMSRYTDAAAPWADAGNASLSMVAQVLTDRRHVESWPLWILVNILSVGLYASQHLLVTAALYAVFLCVAAWGWSQWRRAEVDAA